MNKSPLLIKSALIERIPFIKGKTLPLYGKYFSDQRLYKSLEKSISPETLTAYSLNSDYKVDFIFDRIDITASESFSEEEWLALGHLLRAYKEVENISLMHLYNCLYGERGNSAYGKVVSGRSYTLYTSTQYPLVLKYTYNGEEIGKIKTTKSVSISSPLKVEVPVFKVPETGVEVEVVYDLEIIFFGVKTSPATLVEGIYSGLSSSPQTSVNLVPELLRPGEYSSRLVEFFSGTLITPLSNNKLISQALSNLISPGGDLRTKAISSSKRVFNKDGFIGKETIT